MLLTVLKEYFISELRLNSLLLVGTRVEELFFKEYFEKITLVESNDEALSYYYSESPAIIFFNKQSKGSALEMIQLIREEDRRTIIAIVMKKVVTSDLKNLLSLHLSGVIEKPFVTSEVEKVLENISKDLNFLHEGIIELHGEYLFDTTLNILYDEKEQEVKLTKHELQLMLILLKSKGSYIESEYIEYEIWQVDSSCVDCHNRLKYLVSSIRKKLPKGAIVNHYGLGYKLVYR